MSKQKESRLTNAISYFTPMPLLEVYRLLLPALVPDVVYDADSSAALYPETGDGIGSVVQLVSGIRGPAGLAVDSDYISSDANKAANARLFVTLLEGKLLRFDIHDMLGPLAGFLSLFTPLHLV